MGPSDLRRLLTTRPFQPFRIVMTDGTVYEVHHPDMVIVGRSTAVVGYPDPSEPGVADHFDLVALLHITRVEFIGQPATPTA